MPIIAIIAGVRLVIYPKDHLPPHLYALYSGHEAMISIATGEVLEGKLPLPKLREIRTWLMAHQDQVSYIWREIRLGRYTGGMML